MYHMTLENTVLRSSQYLITMHFFLDIYYDPKIAVIHG